MKNFNQYILIVLFGFALVFSGCQKEYELGQIVTPTNVTLTYELVGADADNPYGDGSGDVIFTATAGNAITFNFNFGDGQNTEIAPDGQVTHTFAKNGINSFVVTVYAVGTGGVSSNKSAELEVYSSFSDDEAMLFLTGGDSKSWYWAADQTGHLGLGPNDMNYENGDESWPAWYQAAPWEKIESTLYLCELVFSMDGNDMTFEQLNPSGEAFIQGIYSEELGLGPEGSYPWDIAGVKNAFFSPSNSIATEVGEYRGTTINLGDGGFMGFYAGSSQYEIISITENVLKVRMVQANEPTFAWYHTFVSVKPEQK